MHTDPSRTVVGFFGVMCFGAYMILAGLATAPAEAAASGGALGGLVVGALIRFLGGRRVYAVVAGALVFAGALLAVALRVGTSREVMDTAAQLGAIYAVLCAVGIELLAYGMASGRRRRPVV